MTKSTILLLVLALSISILSVHAAVPTEEEFKRLMLFNFASWCGNLGITTKWDCFPCKEPELRGFTLDGKVLNASSVMFAYMGHANRTIWVVIRGTVPNSLTSWIMNDLRLWQVPFPPKYDLTRKPQISRGFMHAWQSIELPLLDLMSGATIFCPDCNRVIITGHSLGAAIAPIAALYASDAMGIPKQNIQLITSGGPRIGNIDFAREVQDSVGETYRIVNGGDLVTQVPLRQLGYHHFATEIFIDTNKTQRICDTKNGEDETCSNGLKWTAFVNDNHVSFNGVLTPSFLFRMARDEPASRWCGATAANAPGLRGAFFATADSESDSDNSDSFSDTSFTESDPYQWAQSDIIVGLQDQQFLAQQQQQAIASGSLNTGSSVVVGSVIFVSVLSVFFLAFMIVTLARKDYRYEL